MVVKLNLDALKSTLQGSSTTSFPTKSSETEPQNTSPGNSSAANSQDNDNDNSID